MSTESAKAFIDRLRSDEALSETLMSAENAQDRMNAVKNAGFEFTEEEFQTAIADELGNLSDEELADVAGGRGMTGRPAWIGGMSPSMNFGRLGSNLHNLLFHKMPSTGRPKTGGPPSGAYCGYYTNPI